MVAAKLRKEHYATIITNESNKLIADESIANGGTAKGFAPMDLLVSSLAACTCITLRMYADRKLWPLEEVNTIVSFFKDNDNVSTAIERKIIMTGLLDEEQKIKLLDIANKCPVHKFLSQTIKIITTVQNDNVPIT